MVRSLQDTCDAGQWHPLYKLAYVTGRSCVDEGFFFLLFATAVIPPLLCSISMVVGHVRDALSHMLRAHIGTVRSSLIVRVAEVGFRSY